MEASPAFPRGLASPPFPPSLWGLHPSLSFKKSILLVLSVYLYLCISLYLSNCLTLLIFIMCLLFLYFYVHIKGFSFLLRHIWCFVTCFETFMQFYLFAKLLRCIYHEKFCKTKQFFFSRRSWCKCLVSLWLLIYYVCMH